MNSEPGNLVIGQTIKGETKAVITTIMTGYPKITKIYQDIGLYRKTVLGLSSLKAIAPAMYKVCLDIIERDQNAALPRGMERRIARLMKRTSMTYEEPVEYTYR